MSNRQEVSGFSFAVGVLVLLLMLGLAGEQDRQYAEERPAIVTASK